MNDDEIARRVDRLSPEAQELFWECARWGEETEFKVPADELVANLHQRTSELQPQDRAEFATLWYRIAHQNLEEGLRLKRKAVMAEGFIKLIERAKELDRRAGRPVNESTTTGEAIARLEEAGELGTLERKYWDSVKDDIFWVPREDE